VSKANAALDKSAAVKNADLDANGMERFTFSLRGLFYTQVDMLGSSKR
jgi:hypothetical protein